MESSSVSLSDLSDALPVHPSFTGVPLEIVRHISSFLVEPRVKDSQAYNEISAFSPDMISLSSTSRAFYQAFKSDRYRLVILGGRQVSVDFVGWLTTDDDALQSVRSLVLESCCPLHEYDLYASFIAQIPNLVVFSYDGTHGLHTHIIQSLCSLQRRGQLEAIHLNGAALESIEELVNTHSSEQGGPLSRLKRITLMQGYASEVDTIDLEDEEAVPPPWLIKHPRTSWEEIERNLLKHVSTFLARSASTLESLDLSISPFYNFSFFSSDVPIQTMLFDESKTVPLSTESAELPILGFPSLTALILPIVDLSSPSMSQLLRSSPLLEHVALVHEPLSVSDIKPITFHLPNLLSFTFGCVPSPDGSDSTSQSLMSILDSLRGSPRLLELDVAGPETATFLDPTRLALFSSFTLLTSLSLNSRDWRCTFADVLHLLSTFKHLEDFNFDMDPDITHPPSPAPDASYEIIELGEASATDLVESILDYFYLPQEDSDAGSEEFMDHPTENGQHFHAIFEGLAKLAPTLISIKWEFDELYSMFWSISRGEDGAVSVEGCLLLDELNELVGQEEEGEGLEGDDGWEGIDD